MKQKRNIRINQKKKKIEKKRNPHSRETFGICLGSIDLKLSGIVGEEERICADFSEACWSRCELFCPPWLHPAVHSLQIQRGRRSGGRIVAAWYQSERQSCGKITNWRFDWVSRAGMCTGWQLKAPSSDSVLLTWDFSFVFFFVFVFFLFFFFCFCFLVVK